MKIVFVSAAMLVLFTVTANAENIYAPATAIPHSLPTQPSPTPMPSLIDQPVPQTGIVSKIENSIYGEIIVLNNKKLIAISSDLGYSTIAVGRNCTVTKNAKNIIHWMCV